MALWNKKREQPVETVAVGAPDLKRLAANLDRLGLWRKLPDDVREQNIAAVAEGTHPWATDLSPEVRFRVDGEALAAGGVEALLADLQPAVQAVGATLVFATVAGPETGEYVVSIGTESMRLYGPESWIGVAETEHPWFRSTVLPLAEINRLLIAAGALERFHVLHPGRNDGVALLTDPRVVTAVKNAGLAAGRELPLQP